MSEATVAWAAAGAWAAWLVPAGALCTAVVLYRALGEEGQGWGGGPRAVARRLLFSLLGGALFLLLAGRLEGAPRGEGEPGRAFEDFVKGSLLQRFAHAGLPANSPWLRYERPEEGAREALRRAVRRMPQSAQFRRVLAVAEAEAGNYSAALQSGLAAARIVEARAPGRGRLEGELWRLLYSPTPPSAERLAEALERARTLGLGWVGRTAVLAAAQRTPGRNAPEGLAAAVRAEARRYVLGLAGAMLLALFVIPALGIVTVVVGAVLVRTGVLRPAVRRAAPVAPLLLEGWLLMLLSAYLPALLNSGGQRPAPETNPGAIAMLLLAGDAAQLLALGYVALRLRARGLGLRELGLTRNALGANLVVGLLAALVLMPAAQLVGIATQALSDRLFPNAPPPYHPLSGMTATSQSGVIRGALLVAAVVGAPVLEEIFFRGALFGALRRRWSFAAAAVVSSAIFAALHPQLPLGFLPIAVLALGFAALYEWRQSLVPGMVAHAANNGFAFLMLSLLFPQG